MANPKPLYTLRMTAALPSEPPAKNRKLVHRIIGKFDNTIPGAEWNFVYSRGARAQGAK